MHSVSPNLSSKEAWQVIPPRTSESRTHFICLHSLLIKHDAHLIPITPPLKNALGERYNERHTPGVSLSLYCHSSPLWPGMRDKIILSEQAINITSGLPMLTSNWAKTAGAWRPHYELYATTLAIETRRLPPS